jgi:voltage-gated potassium channel
VHDDSRERFGRAFALGPSLANVAAMAERRERWVRLARAAMVLVVILALGTYGYSYLGEGEHSLVEALYMTVISISTVGFTEVIPITTDTMRIFTMSLIFLGGASVVYFLAAIAAFIIEGDVLYGFWKSRLRARLRRVEGHVIVVGLGRVGFHTFAELFPSRVDILGIDREADRVERLLDRFGEKVLFAVGEGFDEAVLRAAGLERATAIIACLPDDRDNFLLGVTARTLNPDVRILVRLVEPSNEEMFKDLEPIDIVHPPTITGRRVANLLLRRDMLAFTDALIASDTHDRELVELPCPPRLKGRRLAELSLDEHHGHSDGKSDFLIVGHRKADSPRLSFRPPRETVVGAGDSLLCLGHRRTLKTLETRLIDAAEAPRRSQRHTAIISRPHTGDLGEIHPASLWRGHVIVAGAGTVGRAIAKALHRAHTRVCLIDREASRLESFHFDDPSFRVVQGDVFDRKVLLDAGLGEARAFITALQALRDNLFLCAVVRHINPRAEQLARVGTPTESKRLRAMGATVFNPGEIGGVHLARLGLHPELVGFADGLEASLERNEQLAPFTLSQTSPFIGKSLSEAALDKQSGCIILGFKRRGASTFAYHPAPSSKLEGGSTLLALGDADELERMTRLLEKS